MIIINSLFYNNLWNKTFIEIFNTTERFIKNGVQGFIIQWYIYGSISVKLRIKCLYWCYN